MFGNDSAGGEDRQTDDMIPKRIVQTGPKELSLGLKAGMMNARLLHPTFEYLFFDDAKVEWFVRNEFPQYLSTFDSFRVRIQRYDFFRYLAIYRYGGFYLDLDVLLAEALTPLLHCDCVFPFEELTESEYFWREFKMDWHVGNYAFGASPGHPFLAAIIENCVRAKENPAWVTPMMKWAPKLVRDEAYVLNTTGPGLVSRTLGENSGLATGMTMLFPDDILDIRQWHHFGHFGVHYMDGSWRRRDKPLAVRLWRRYEAWQLRRSLLRGRSERDARQMFNLGAQSSAAIVAEARKEQVHPECRL